MTAPHTTVALRRAKSMLVVLCAAALAACSSLRPTPTQPPAFFALTAPPAVATERAPAAPGTLPTLVITPPRAASGFDSQRVIFVRNDHQLEYFAHSEWVDTPARMLGPLLTTTLEHTEAFGAVVLTPASAVGELRLDTEIILLQHSFRTQPSRVQFTLRAYLVDEKTRKVLAWQEFQGEAEAASDTPQGGIAAANVAVQDVLTQLAIFMAQQKR